MIEPKCSVWASWVLKLERDPSPPKLHIFVLSLKVTLKKFGNLLLSCVGLSHSCPPKIAKSQLRLFYTCVWTVFTSWEIPSDMAESLHVLIAREPELSAKQLLMCHEPHPPWNLNNLDVSGNIWELKVSLWTFLKTLVTNKWVEHTRIAVNIALAFKGMLRKPLPCSAPE